MSRLAAPRETDPIRDVSLDAARLAMALTDGDGRIVEASAALGELFDCHPAALRGEVLAELLGKAAAETSQFAGTCAYRMGGRWWREHRQGPATLLVDVTPEHAFLAQARREIAAQDALMHAAEVGVWRYDPETELYVFSTALSLGHSGAGQPVPLAMLQSLQHRDDQALDTEIRDRLTTEPGSTEAEMRYRDSAGGWRHLRVLYRTGGQLPSGRYELLGISLNVTDLALARDEARTATAAKSTFLASVSHEIRTPMNGIVGVLNLLKRESLTADGRTLLGEALDCSEMLGQLINDVLDFSKIEAEKLEIAPAPTDAADVLAGVVALLRPQADAKGIHLRFQAESVGWVEVDPVRLRQCLFNVIGNAVKFTQVGGVDARMTLAGDGTARRLRCEVADTGVGIPEAAQDALFGRFQQAEVGTTRRFGGTGLGLAISRSLTRLMGGDMGFESTLGEGSTFWFEVLAPPATPAAAGPADFPDARPLEGVAVLLVDDNRINRLVGLKSLEALGASVETAADGSAAIAAAGGRGFDLVLMDINMPGMDGLEATRRIRALGGALTEVPIVALTADAMDHHLETYRAAGLNGFIAKPFSPASLLAEIARLAG
jgi:signal transduction histidine kinase/CheY-like chemotaxis protein